MSDRPAQRPEGRLIGEAQKRSPLSQRQAAAAAGMSEQQWRAIVSGYRTVNAGIYAAVRGPAETVARMARIVRVTPDDLATIGERPDAAEELRKLPPEPEPDRPRTPDEVAEALETLREGHRQLKAQLAQANERLAELERQQGGGARDAADG